MAIVAMCLAVTTPVSAAPPAADIERFLQDQQAEHRIPGLAYAIVRGDRVIRQAAWGVDGGGAALSPQTPFLIGSVSKPFTALAVMQQVEAGRIALDDPVRRHLPWFRLADDTAAGRVTVRQLLTHTSGLPKWASRTDRFDNTADGLARSVRDLADVEPSPGAAHTYSDANYMVLGALVEAVAGRPFGEVLRERVFGPLDMRHAAATAAEAGRAGLSAGHRYWFGHPRRFDRGYDTSGVPYGYVAAGLDDLSHFAMAQLNGGRYAGDRVLSAEGITRMHTGLADTGGGGRYGLGWRTTASGTVWHAGATPGYFAHVVLVPEADLGVVVLANSYSLALDGPLATLGFSVARMAQDEPPQPGSPDPALAAALYVLVAVAALLTVAVVRSLFRLVRPRPRTSRARAAAAAVAGWVAGCAALIGLVLAGLPAMLGGDLGQALLWTPDLGWTIVAVAVLSGFVAFLRIGITARDLRASRT